MRISQKAFDMIVAEEVSSQAYYIRHYQHPEWPGLSSGVTVGIGYDLGQSPRQKIADDWKNSVSPDMILMMMSCAGIVGPAGKQKCSEVWNGIIIPWNSAITVFANRDIPQWTAAVINAVPGSDKLNGDLLGVLVDIAYNRGIGGFNSTNDRFREMKSIRVLVSTGNLNLVPLEIQRMKRLWPNTIGLQRRCDHRIALWRGGMTKEPFIEPLAMFKAEPAQELPLDAGPARTKPPITSATQNATAAAIAITGLATAISHPSWEVFFFALLASSGIACVVWVIWHQWRNPDGIDFGLR